MQLSVDEHHVCVNATITNDAYTVHTFPLGVECCVFCPHSSGDGGVIAAIVVSVFIMVAGIAVVVIILAVYIRRKKRLRSYSFTNSLRSTETDRSRVYVNVTATAVSQVHIQITESYNIISSLLAALH